MSQDRELEIQRQFLDEAQEYLGTLEDALLGLANSRVDGQKINAALRAAHSIKGGAAMMSFHTLSDLAHRLEDSFKVLKTQKQSVKVDADLENLLLSGVDCLRYVIRSDRETLLKGKANQTINEQWLHTQALPIFEQLHDRLGDPQSEDAASVLSPEEGQDIIPLIFETEVEGCLQRLEEVLANPEQPCLQEEVSILAQELGGLGEMLQLSAFSQLCESITVALATPSVDVVAVAQAALKAWRRSQALVLSHQLDLLPTEIEGVPQTAAATPATPITIPIETEEIPASVAAAWEQAEATEDGFDFSFDQNFAAFEQDIAASVAASASEYAPETPEATESTTHHTYETQVHEFVSESRVTDFKLLPDPSDVAIEEDPDATVRVPIKQLNQLNDLFGELTIERNALDLYLKRLRGLTRTLIRRVQSLDQSNVQMRTLYDRITMGGIREVGLPLFDFGAAIKQPLAPPHVLLNLPDPQQAGNGHHDDASDAKAEPLMQNEFDVLEMDRYSDLHLLSQQLMETIVQIQEVTSDIELSLDDTEQTARNLNKTSKQLQSSLTHIRMRPLSDIVDRFPRALRELCLQYDKKAKLNIVGATTLIDRNILEALNDPLMHLLRNAFDHGIETPETRIAHGKPEEGTIEIQAFHRGNRTIITLSDDGGGIPIDKIRTKAERMGLDATLLAAASDEELLSLIFEPGFSTTERVTSLSGRGVGMDVVRDSLKQVRGEIKVDTQSGAGTTFTLSVPFTLSVVRVLLAESNGMLLAFPADVVGEIVMLKPEEVIMTAGRPAIAWEGEIVQLIVLSRWLEFRCPRQPYTLESPPNINSPAILLATHGSQLVGIQIDRCWGEQEVAIRRVEGNIPMPPGFTNCTIMGDGRVVPLVNVPEMLRWVASSDRSPAPTSPPIPSTQLTLNPANYTPSLRAATTLATTALPNALPAAAIPAPTLPGMPPTLPSSMPPAMSPHIPMPTVPMPTVTHPPTTPPIAPLIPKGMVLVVDDSINVRRFLALTLEKAGYQVEQAKDGQDALEKLQSGLQVQAVVCDIEMPRLDGYGFLAKLKANPAFANLPITMLTSRSGDKHRQLAISLGAAAYFSKPYNEQALLKNLEQLIHQAVAV
jgi:two-component system, chemotaxis family, sensor histidine kinase and response regulator PixL